MPCNCQKCRGFCHEGKPNHIFLAQSPNQTVPQSLGQPQTGDLWINPNNCLIYVFTGCSWQLLKCLAQPVLGQLTCQSNIVIYDGCFKMAQPTDYGAPVPEGANVLFCDPDTGAISFGPLGATGICDQFLGASAIPCDADLLFCGASGPRKAAIQCGDDVILSAVDVFVDLVNATVEVGGPMPPPVPFDDYLLGPTNPVPIGGNRIMASTEELDLSCFDRVLVLASSVRDLTQFNQPDALSLQLTGPDGVGGGFLVTSQYGTPYQWYSIPLLQAIDFRVPGVSLQLLTETDHGGVNHFGVAAIRLVRGITEQGIVHCADMGLAFGHLDFANAPETGVDPVLIQFGGLPQWNVRDLLFYTNPSVLLEPITFGGTFQPFSWTGYQGFQAAPTFNQATGVYTAPKTGYYQVTVNCSFELLSDGTLMSDFLLQVQHPVNTLVATQRVGQVADELRSYFLSTTWIGPATKGDTIRVGYLANGPGSGDIHHRSISIESL